MDALGVAQCPVCNEQQQRVAEPVRMPWKSLIVVRCVKAEGHSRVFNAMFVSMERVEDRDPEYPDGKQDRKRNAYPNYVFRSFGHSRWTFIATHQPRLYSISIVYPFQPFRHEDAPIRLIRGQEIQPICTLKSF
jgi:hypothetical protein